MNKSGAVIGVPIRVFAAKPEVFVPLARRLFNNAFALGDVEDLNDNDVTLIEKEGADIFNPPSWRPIEIRNALSAWYATVLSLRSKWARQRFAREEQYGMEVGAAPEDIIFIFKLLFQQARYGIVPQEIKGMRYKPTSQLVLMLDFEKLFSKLPWGILHEYMEARGFGPRFIRAVMLTLQQRTVRFRTAFGRTEPLTPAAGGAQGCQLTCEAASMVVDCFITTLVRETRGTQLNDEVIKALVWVDDVYTTPRDMTDLQKGLQVALEWERATALLFHRKKGGFFEYNRRLKELQDEQDRKNEEQYTAGRDATVKFRSGTGAGSVVGIETKGTKVIGVEAGSRARKQGVKEHWRIISVDGKLMDSQHKFF
eukprot:gene58071-biopygen105372